MKKKNTLRDTASKTTAECSKRKKSCILGRLNSDQIANLINSAIAVLTLFTVIISFVTILEMKTERKLAYKPTIAINPIEIEFSWDRNGFEEWVKVSDNKPSTLLEDGSIVNEITIPISILYDGSIEKLDVVNIGAGAAKDISFSWDKNNVDNLTECLTALDYTKRDFCHADVSLIFSYGDHMVMVDREKDQGFMYLLPDAVDKQPLSFPAQYSLLIHEIIKTGKYNNDLRLLFYLEYDDIQGIHYKDIGAVFIKKTFYLENDDGSGLARYQLIPQFAE